MSEKYESRHERVCPATAECRLRRSHTEESVEAIQTKRTGLIRLIAVSLPNDINALERGDDVDSDIRL